MSEMSETEARDPRLVETEPTKTFFVSMLVRDIELLPAIIDLLDNSVDGARRVRGNGSYAGLWVRITYDQESFAIEDNCGGITLETARLYAFRFGRDPRRAPEGHTIGQFGVGMKRTLFKLGRDFTVESHTPDEWFRLPVNVTAWEQSEQWEFEFSQYGVAPQAQQDVVGTRIEVRDLLEEAKQDFANASWRTRLTNEARLKHRRALDRGLDIRINESSLQPMPLSLIETDTIKPSRTAHTYPVGDKEVQLVLLAGVSESRSSEAGWYVFCNERVVVASDQTALTAWVGGGRQSRHSIPAYHDQYARFRGYAFFDCDDPALLPWNTTKTGVDADNRIWRDARQKMQTVTRPVIDFLNLLDKVVTATGGDGRTSFAGADDDQTEELEAFLESAALKDAPLISLDDVQGAETFSRPTIDIASLPKPITWIRYSRDAAEVDQVRQLLGGSSKKDMPPSEVGQRTFDYFLRNER